ncbi:TPA: sugar phosphate isomerase/epimerase, partial [Candidatus Bathyarchaeota archaeon]|nr:sugar phosphate isomerase/epimerase [Candidatus Bathyarchaeota archaeon]
VEEIEKRILVEEMKMLGKYAENIGAYIILEPLNRYETHFIRRLDQAAEVCREVKLDYVRVMADFFHMNIEEADISESLEAVADLLVHVHLADSNRILPGYGHTDFRKPFKTLKRVGYKNFMALECSIPGNPNVELPKCVKYLRSFM